jgi:hypothetical protein
MNYAGARMSGDSPLMQAAKQARVDKYAAQEAMGGGLGFAHKDALQRVAEVPNLLEILSRELAEAEQSFAELRGRLSIVTRPEEAAPAVAGQVPQSVPSTDMGNLIRGLVNRVDELTGAMSSVIRRLEV